MTRIFSISMGFVAMALTFAWAPDAGAWSSELSNFNNYYGTSGTRLNTCGVCHYNFNGGGSVNPYGNDYKKNGYSFAPIESLDSDGDGFVSSEEIALLFMPGLSCANLASASNAPPDIADYVDPGNPACATAPVDNDGDGYEAGVDCDDNDASVNPGAQEICDDGIDNDCDGSIDSADPDCRATPTPGDDDDDDDVGDDDDDDDDDTPPPTGCTADGRLDPTGHFGLLPFLVVPLLVRIRKAYRSPSSKA